MKTSTVIFIGIAVFAVGYLISDYVNYQLAKGGEYPKHGGIFTT